MVAAAAVTAAMCARGVTLSEPRLSPGGERLGWVAAAGGRAELHVVELDGGPVRTVTTEPVPAAGPAYGGGAWDWFPDGASVVYAGRDGGLWRVPVAGGPAVALVAGGGTPGRAAAPVVAPDGRFVAYVVDQREVAVVAVGRADAGAGGSVLDAARDEWPVKLSTGADFCLDPAWTASGGVVWHEWDVPAMAWDESRLVHRLASASSAPTVVHAPPGAAVAQPRPAPGGSVVACVSDEWGWANVTLVCPGEAPRRLVAEEHEHGGPAWGHGQRSFAWSPDGRHVAYARNEAGFGRLAVVDVATGAVRDAARGVHGSLTWAGGRLAALRSGARTPTEVVVYDTTTWARTTMAVGPVCGFEAAGLPEPEPFTTTTDDGTLLHARWYPPRPGTFDAGGPAPTVVWIHGGPTDQWDVRFRPRLAYLAARGWAVLVPDHRGSTGHGRAYTQALRGGWGELDDADCARLTDAAVTAGRADPRRLAVMGGSAGGLTVLNLLARHPDRFAAGIALYPVTDLLDLNERTHRFEAHYCHSLVGPLPDAVDRYRSRSPMAAVERITTPLLVLHGTADEVVPVTQTDALVARLVALGRPVEHHRYEGEGHGWSRPETVVDELDRIGDFLGRYAGRWRR